MIIAIDGPTASGKSTIAHMLAQRLGIYYVATGMLYRALAYVLVQHCRYTVTDLSCVRDEDLERCLGSAGIRYAYENGQAMLFWGDTPITQYLKTAEMDTYASLVATQKQVRVAMVQFQRILAAQRDVVVEGRDIGSVVLPHADYKFFITASIAVRAKRWQHDQEKQGRIYSLSESEAHIKERDTRDTMREHSPLVVVPGAVVIDTSDLTKEETLERIVLSIKRFFL